MYYLPCNHCGHLNEVKSEYLTFCTNCNKKMENNYADWHRSNYDKTFEDYKILVCVPETQQTIQQQQPSYPRTGEISIGIILSIIMAVIIGTLTFAGYVINIYQFSQRTVQTPEAEMPGEGWTTAPYGDDGLWVATPVRLEKMEVPLDDEVKKLVEQMDTYNYTTDDGLSIVVNSVRYKPEVGSLDLQGALEGSTDAIKASEGVTDFDYTEQDLEKEGIPGLMQEGHYSQFGVPMEFVNTGFVSELILWQVVLTYRADDYQGKKNADRIIESIEIYNAD